MFKNSNLAIFLNATADRHGYDNKKIKKGEGWLSFNLIQLNSNSTGYS